MLLVIIVVAAIVVIAAAFALMPRFGGRSHRGRAGVAGRERAVAAEDPDATRVSQRHVPREERTLIAEGEAIREHVESRIESERAVRPRARVAPAYSTADPAYAPVDPGYAPVDPGYAPVDPGYTAVDPPYAARVDPAYAPVDPAYARVDPAYGRVDPAYPVAGAGAPVGMRPGGYLTARDELALQIARDQRERYPNEYPAAGRLAGRPLVGGLQPEQPPVSDALELQLQEVAMRSRGRVVPPARGSGAPVSRRRMGRRRAAAVDVEDDRLA